MILDGSNEDISISPCKAKNADGIRCTLDAIHTEFGGSHMARTEDGITIFWKDTESDN